jgi:hydroxyacylglutathione hydrolase
MNLLPLPAFDDNYIWMLHDGRHALVVDPGDAGPVLQALQAQGLRLAAILVTHHHQDHTGGIDVLREATGAKVYGPAKEKIPAPFEKLTGGDQVHEMGLSFHVLDVPGHTGGHIAFFSDTADFKPLLFCGDTLFSGGCGRLFEGTPAQMQHSLTQFAALPGDTQVCCTHEYTLSNLKFALEVEPDNQDLIAYNEHCKSLRRQGLPTLPSSMTMELKINPFLRCDTPAIMRAVREHSAEDAEGFGTFATLRQWKNSYR